MVKIILVSALLASFSSTPPARAAGDVFLFGGGPRPAPAIQEFLESAAAVPAQPKKILIVGWASAVPDETMAGLRGELEAAGGAVSLSPAPPQSETEVERFLEQVAEADGLFFSGGDQNRILEAFGRSPQVRDRILERWQTGAPLAGTSAGTAILSQWVFTGNEDLTRIDPSSLALLPGLGTLGGTIIDQHFLVRQRENRLISAVLRYPGILGVGIDEGNVLVVRTQSGIGKVIGPTGVMFIERSPASDSSVDAAPQLLVSLVQQGSCWSFASRRPTPCL